MEIDLGTPLYYQDHSSWGSDEFSYLNSYLNRLFLYSEDADKAAAISTLDYSRMSWETQALICAIINHYGKASELKTEYPNLEPFTCVAPLERPLFLNERPVDIFPAYKRMNIRY